jgi:hypothetical protein
MKSVRLFFLSGLMLTVGILGSTADTGNEVQPDILGVKLGMTAAEARLLVAGHHLKQYAETKAKLTFPGSNFAPIEMEGSDYITGMANYTETVVPGKNPPEVEEAFEVLMSAIPGGEKVTDVYRNFTIHPKEKQFAFSALRESFIQKYGKPTIEQDAPFQSRMMWKYFEYSGPREQMRCYSAEDFITPVDRLLKVHEPIGAKPWTNSVIIHNNYNFYYKCFGEYYRTF